MASPASSNRAINITNSSSVMALLPSAPAVWLPCTPLGYTVCKARSTLRSRWPQGHSSGLIEWFGWDPPATSERIRRREPPEISERLRRVGGGGYSAGALEPELLDAGLEGGGLEAKQRGGAARPADAPAGLVQRGHIVRMAPVGKTCSDGGERLR